MDAEQALLGKLDQVAKKQFPDAQASTHARMLIAWRALLPFSEKNCMLLGDKELKAAAGLAQEHANSARIVGQSPVPDLLDRLSKSMSGAKRGWFSGRKDDPNKLVKDLQAQEEAVQRAFDANQDAGHRAVKLHNDLEAYYQAAECLLVIAEDAWKSPLESRRHLLHQAVYNLELSQAHLQQQEKLLAQWKEDIQRLVYLIYPNWQLGQT